MTAPLPLLDPTRCPVCGELNQCAMEVQKATGVQQQACWCTRVDFSDDLLARIAPQHRDLNCICARCAQGDAAR